MNHTNTTFFQMLQAMLPRSARGEQCSVGVQSNSLLIHGTGLHAPTCCKHCMPQKMGATFFGDLQCLCHKGGGQDRTKIMPECHPSFAAQAVHAHIARHGENLHFNHKRHGHRKADKQTFHQRQRPVNRWNLDRHSVFETSLT